MVHSYCKYIYMGLDERIIKPLKLPILWIYCEARLSFYELFSFFFFLLPFLLLLFIICQLNDSFFFHVFVNPYYKKMELSERTHTDTFT